MYTVAEPCIEATAPALEHLYHTFCERVLRNFEDGDNPTPAPPSPVPYDVATPMQPTQTSRPSGGGECVGLCVGVAVGLSA